MRLPSGLISLAAAAVVGAGAVTMIVVDTHRSSHLLLSTVVTDPQLAEPQTDPSSLQRPSPLHLTAGTTYHVVLTSSYCPLSAGILPDNQLDTDPRAVLLLIAPATTGTVQHVDRDFSVSATGIYYLEEWGNDGTPPNPNHPCQVTATVSGP